ncbi:MAG: GNAT family N-acetyltransferase [Acidovorax sp.]|uniref:GNAT family N-acetyltransferase n=1 Tax=Acidovorax sp. TaxID=1872122 RepID=UPI0026226CAE|nr:GNAT family N-acetyltransferase [Acidovorax sp.]MDH4427348.1 GNAT family N-acetyltransferase [Acidovorax sp.]MDH4466374.1 GNAT family N-acetyltransferase [Acidovorax sp.]
MSTLHIREATLADVESVLALYAAIEDSLADVLTLEQAQAVWAQFARYPSYRLWVACDAANGDAVVGTYALLVMHNLAHRGAPSAIVEDVVVAPDLQGRGVGRQMMAHAMQQARDAGCYKLALSSNARRTGAHAFYESLGFAQHGLSFVVDTLT